MAKEMNTAGQALLDDVLAIKAGTTIKILFLSFWGIGLYNFPEGGFSKKTISGSDARKLLMEAAQDGKLTCVSDDDLNAPYNGSAAAKLTTLGELRSNRSP